jgi:hypothetical protein
MSKTLLPIVTALVAVAACASPRSSTSGQGGAAAAVPGDDYGSVLAAAVDEVRREFPFGRVIVDRVVADTSMRLAPPIASRREHIRPEDWARQPSVEVVPTEGTVPVCNVLRTECRLPADVAGVIALGDPDIRGDSARVIVRYAENFGTTTVKVRTTVVELTMLRTDGEWKVRQSRVRAVG